MTQPFASNRADQPVPLVLCVLPFGVLGVGAYLVRGQLNGRNLSILAVGFVMLLLLSALGPLRDWDAFDQYPLARRVVMQALVGIMVVVAACCVYLAVDGFDGPLSIYPAFVFVPGWFVLAELFPLWAESPVVRRDDPPTGWTTIAGFPLFYSDPADATLWVYVRPVLDRLTAPLASGVRWGMYTPNLGHRWGRATLKAFGVLGAGMLALMFASSSPNGFLP